MTALAVVFWVSAAAIVYTHAGYPLLLRVIGRRARHRKPAESDLPSVTLIVAAHDEQTVIERKLRNSLELDYPRGLLEVIVASDGSGDRTVEIARSLAAGDDRVKVLDLERAGKVRAQDVAADVATGDVLAFSDANAYWEADALRKLVAPFADEEVGYVCGELRYESVDGSNQEGAYWRFETANRDYESRLHSVTAGNGAIYAVRDEAYLRLDPRTSHDLSLPFNLVKRGWLALSEPSAVAVERPLATNEGEFARKRRMMSHAWPAILGGGMLDPRGYGPVYAFEIFSHRALRYATPFLHVIAFVANLALVGEGLVYVVTLAIQLAFVMAAIAGRLTRGRPRVLALCQYYLLTTASIAAGLWDWLRRGTPTTWEKAQGRA
ncbi:MAG: glycosyltransferase family 2 protein [Solirubrobacterales bacterium]